MKGGEHALQSASRYLKRTNLFDIHTAAAGAASERVSFAFVRPTAPRVHATLTLEALSIQFFSLKFIFPARTVSIIFIERPCDVGGSNIWNASN